MRGGPYEPAACADAEDRDFRPQHKRAPGAPHGVEDATSRRRSVQRLLILDGGVVCGAATTGGGELEYFRYDPTVGKAERLEALPDDRVEPLELSDPDSAFTWDATGRVAYSLDRNGQLLRHTGRGDARKTEALGQVAGTRPFESDPPGYQRSRAMFFDGRGDLYTAGEGGHVFRFSPATGQLDRLDARLPAVRGREAWATLDAAALGPDGLVYAGTFDGYLVAIDLTHQAVTNLGKPLRQHLHARARPPDGGRRGGRRRRGHPPAVAAVSEQGTP